MTTQFARASYQEIIDLHTEESTVSVIGIHTPQGDTPRKMFGGFFDQFKKFKYLGCSVSLVPAARLPADPSQVSYEAGEQYIDPRDMLNPLMFHGCHGNDMGVILNRFYNANSIADSPQTDSTFYYADSVTDITDGDHISGLQLEDLYYKALTDNTWKKAHPQRGFKKAGLRPLVYSMATNMQFNGSSIGMSGFGIPEDTVDDVSASGQSITATFPVSQDGRRFFTPRLTGLGWLDTRNVLTTATTVTGSTADIRAMLGDAALNQQDASDADLPLVYMGMILLPPAYKTEQYFRMIVNHHFAFKDFRGISFSNNLVEPPAYNQLNEPDERYYPDGDPVNPDDPDDPGDGGDDSGGGGSTSGPLILNKQVVQKYTVTDNQSPFKYVFAGAITPDNTQYNGSASISQKTNYCTGAVFGFVIDSNNILRYIAAGCNYDPSGSSTYLYDKTADAFYQLTGAAVTSDGVFSYSSKSSSSSGTFDSFILESVGADAFSKSSAIYQLIDTDVTGVTMDTSSW